MKGEHAKAQALLYATHADREAAALAAAKRAAADLAAMVAAEHLERERVARLHGWRCGWCTCGIKETTERLDGPDGPETLCVDCGVSWAAKRKQGELREQEREARTPTPEERWRLQQIAVERALESAKEDMRQGFTEVKEPAEKSSERNCLHCFVPYADWCFFYRLIGSSRPAHRRDRGQVHREAQRRRATRATRCCCELLPRTSRQRSTVLPTAWCKRRSKSVTKLG